MQSTHTHILLFDSKFHIILAMYVQYIENIEIIGYFRKYHYFLTLVMMMTVMMTSIEIGYSRTR